MSYWNYRVIKKFYEKADATTFEIHEVYYDKNHKIEGWTESAVGPSGETVSELKEDIEHFVRALQKPTLMEQLKNGKEILVEINENNS